MSRHAMRLRASILFAVAALVLPSRDARARQRVAALSVPATEALDDASRTRVLVLATPHLAAVEGLDVSALEPLRAALANSFRPDVVAVESLPSEVVEEMEWRGGDLTEVVQSFAAERLAFGRRMRDVLKVSRAEAEKRAEAALRTATDLDADARLDVVRFLVAAYDWNSAVLQWSYLPARAREGGALPEGLAARLNASLAANGPARGDVRTVGKARSRDHRRRAQAVPRPHPRADDGREGRLSRRCRDRERRSLRG